MTTFADNGPGVWITGEFTSSPLGLPDTAERIKARLADAGWTVKNFNYDTATDELFAFLPIPTSHRVKAKLHRSDREYSPAEAAAALRLAAEPEGWDLDLIGEYGHELHDNIIKPTIDPIITPKKWPWWVWAAGGVLAFGVVGYGLNAIGQFIPRSAR